MSALEVLDLLEPFALLATVFALAWTLMPLLRNQPAWLLVLIVAYPVVRAVSLAVAEQTWASILYAGLMASLPVFVILRGDRKGRPPSSYG